MRFVNPSLENKKVSRSLICLVATIIGTGTEKSNKDSQLLHKQVTTTADCCVAKTLTLLFCRKIVYNQQKWTEIKNTTTALAQAHLEYQKEGLVALRDSALATRRLLTLANTVSGDSPHADETNAAFDDLSGVNVIDANDATLGKNTINENELSGSLSIHVVGPYITFYLIQLKADGLYCMTELTHVQYPMSVSEVPAYVTNFSNLKNVLHDFQSFCKYEDANANLSSWRRNSLLAADIMLILEKRKIGSAKIQLGIMLVNK